MTGYTNLLGDLKTTCDTLIAEVEAEAVPQG